MSARLKTKIVVPGSAPQPLWYTLPRDASAPVGTLVEIPLQSRVAVGIVLEVEEKLPPELEGLRLREVVRVHSHLKPFPGEWLELMDWLRGYYHATLPAAFQTAISKAAFKRLLQVESASKKRTDTGSRDGVPTPVTKPSTERTADQAGVFPETFPLNAYQKTAVEQVQNILTAPQPSFQSFLLHGVTGSGKTLVYIRLVEACLQSGRNALILVPEIALTPLSLARFRDALPVRVQAMHSNLSAAEHRELWEALGRGEARVILGVRSAALCPLDNIGLIVVDEEHDGSFKHSDAAPRYNARDVALYRGRQHQCPVVLGSATPSLESYHHALTGKHVLLKLPERATRSPLPQITLVDMREQLKLQGDNPLSIPLRETMAQALKAGEQVILLLNRRGYGKRRLHKESGEAASCPRCSVPLVPHKGKGMLLCHHCGFSEKAPFHDASEASPYLDVGWAIEKVEEYLGKIFPEFPCLRLDRDSTQRKGSLQKILKAFESGKASILLGTQMVAKGHDFKNVHLVGVLDADGGLGLPDFRGQERVFQLITQVAGRAGRHSQKGKVILQSFQPDNPAVTLALKGDMEAFYHQEWRHRKELGYPPATRMFKVEILGNDWETVRLAMEEYAGILTRLGQSIEFTLLGPSEAPIKRIKYQYRWQIYGKSPYASQVGWLLNKSLEAFVPRLSKKLKLAVDVDPINVM